MATKEKKSKFAQYDKETLRFLEGKNIYSKKKGVSSSRRGWTKLEFTIRKDLHKEIKKVKEREGFPTLAEAARCLITWGLENIEEED